MRSESLKNESPCELESKERFVGLLSNNPDRRQLSECKLRLVSEGFQIDELSGNYHLFGLLFDCITFRAVNHTFLERIHFLVETLRAFTFQTTIIAQRNYECMLPDAACHDRANPSQDS